MKVRNATPAPWLFLVNAHSTSIILAIPGCTCWTLPIRTIYLFQYCTCHEVVFGFGPVILISKPPGFFSSFKSRPTFWKIFYVNKLRHCIDHIRFRHCKQVKTQTCTFQRFKSHYKRFRKSFWGGLSNSAESRGEHDVSWPQIFSNDRWVPRLRFETLKKCTKNARPFRTIHYSKIKCSVRNCPLFVERHYSHFFQKLQVPKLDDFQCFRCCLSTGKLDHLFAWDSPANPW